MRRVLEAIQDPWVRWDWVADHADDIQARLLEHVELTLTTVGLGTLGFYDDYLKAFCQMRRPTNAWQPASTATRF